VLVGQCFYDTDRRASQNQSFPDDDVKYLFTLGLTGSAILRTETFFSRYILHMKSHFKTKCISCSCIINLLFFFRLHSAEHNHDKYCICKHLVTVPLSQADGDNLLFYIIPSHWPTLT